MSHSPPAKRRRISDCPNSEARRAHVSDDENLPRKLAQLARKGRGEEETKRKLESVKKENEALENEVRATREDREKVAKERNAFQKVAWRNTKKLLAFYDEFHGQDVGDVLKKKLFEAREPILKDIEWLETKDDDEVEEVPLTVEEKIEILEQRGMASVKAMAASLLKKPVEYYEKGEVEFKESGIWSSPLQQCQREEIKFFTHTLDHNHFPGTGMRIHEDCVTVVRFTQNKEFFVYKIKEENVHLLQNGSEKIGTKIVEYAIRVHLKLKDK